MGLPDRDVARAWVGRTVVDRDGAEIGACTGVFLDDATELPEWVCTELGGAIVFIPAVGAADSGEQVRVAVSRAEVNSAPSVGSARHISEDEEARLYLHYGIPHSREVSRSLLPVGETQPPADAVAPDADGAVAPDAAGIAPESPAPTPLVREDLSRPEPATNAEPSRTADSTPPARGRRLVVLMLWVLAGLGTVGAIMRARRRRTRRLPLGARGRRGQTSRS